MPYTALEFRDKTFKDGHIVSAYRDREHFIQAECATFDIDHMSCGIEGPTDTPPSMEDWRKETSLLSNLSFKAYWSPSARYNIHGIAPLSRPITDPKELRIVQEWVQSQVGLLGISGECDEKVKDVARFYFPGPNVNNPSAWIFENDAKVLDVDSVLNHNREKVEEKGEVKRSRRGRPRNPGVYESELIKRAITPGSRNDGCFNLARYYGGKTETEEEARALYNAVVPPQEDFPQEEVDKCFENGYKTCTPGSLILPSSPVFQDRTQAQFKTALARAVSDIQEACKLNYRMFTTLGLTSDDKDDPRWKSNRICRLIYTTSQHDRGYAEPLDSTAEFEAFIGMQIDKYKDSDPDLWLKLMEKRRHYFPSSMLSPKGLILRHANEAQYLDGRVLYKEGLSGEVRPSFEPIKSGEFYTEIFPFEHKTQKPLEGSPIWEYLTSWLPKRTGQKGKVSVELLLLADFFRSAVGGILGNEQALIFDSPASYGKSTFVGLQSAALKKKAVKKFPDSLLTGQSSRFAWLGCVDSYIGYFMDPPVGRVLDNIQLKQVISSDSKSVEIKGGAAWDQETFYRTEIFTNDMPRLKDPTDDGVRRRLRMIKLWRKFTGERGLPSREMIEGFREFICTCARLPKLPDEVWQEYPALKDWLSESCESDLFNEVLIKDPNSRDFVKVSELKAVLRAAGNPLTRMPSGDFEKLLHAAGFRTPRRACGKVIPHCRFNEESTEWKTYKGLYVNESHVDYGSEENDDEKAKWQSYFDKINPLLESLPIPFDSAPEYVKSEAFKSQSENSMEESVEADVNNEEEWSQDEWDYYTNGAEPLPLQDQDRKPDAPESVQSDSSCASKPELPIEKEINSGTPIARNPDKIEPICVKDIKPWKPLDLPEGCRDVPGEICNWIRDVGVEESGVAAVCAGRELAEKLPKKWDLEVVLKDAPMGEFRAVLVKAFYEQRE